MPVLGRVPPQTGSVEMRWAKVGNYQEGCLMLYVTFPRYPFLQWAGLRVSLV